MAEDPVAAQGQASYGGYLTWDDHPALAQKPKVNFFPRSAQCPKPRDGPAVVRGKALACQLTVRLRLSLPVPFASRFADLEGRQDPQRLPALRLRGQP